MARKKTKKAIGKRQYINHDKAIVELNKKIISEHKKGIQRIKGFVEAVIEKIIVSMKKKSPVFKKLYINRFGSGSVFEGLQLNIPDELTVNFLLKIPEAAKPVLYESEIPGHVFLKVENLQKLSNTRKDIERNIHDEIKCYLDDENYLLAYEMSSKFLQHVFEKAFCKEKYEKGISIKYGKKTFSVERVKYEGSQIFKLSIRRTTNFQIYVNLVPCILLKKEQWPSQYRQNPLDFPPDFFITPHSPDNNKDRYWRLSFQKQEVKIFFAKSWLKPTLRVIKLFRDYLKLNVSNYAIKTLFLWTLLENDGRIINNDKIPELWNGPQSYCIVYMLNIFLNHLEQRKIPYFWNTNLNLIDNLRDEEIDLYKEQICGVLEEFRKNETSSFILRYISYDEVDSGEE